MNFKGELPDFCKIHEDPSFSFLTNPEFTVRVNDVYKYKGNYWRIHAILVEGGRLDVIYHPRERNNPMPTITTTEVKKLSDEEKLILESSL